MAKAVLTWLILLFSVSSVPGSLLAQEKHWVFFADKCSDEALSAEDLGISDAAMARRMVSGGNVVTEQDYPVCKSYLDQLRALGAKIHARSRWLNAASITVSDAQLREIMQLPFVIRTRPVAHRLTSPAPSSEDIVLPALQKTAAHELDYGDSYLQVELLNVPRVHDVWIDGTNALIGMLDNGFRWRAHEALMNQKVIGEYDFIYDDGNTAHEEGDPVVQDGHGTLTFSVIGGFKAGALIGTAYNAEFLLAKTEMNSREIPAEEDFWVEGIEWLEMNGASVVSSSVGYDLFEDNTGYRYQNGDFDGKTAVTSRAAAIAARRGVTVVQSTGNEGSSGIGTLIVPSDADSIVSVGAVNFSNELASFSSVGPTNDGRIKPDVVAPGVAVYYAHLSSPQSYARANGTSLSAPLAAGVAALVRSARPELTPIQVREALRETADRADSAGSRYGWGLVNAWEAVLYHGMVMSTNPRLSFVNGYQSFSTYVLSHAVIDPENVTITYTVNGESEQTVALDLISEYESLPAGSGLYVFDFPELPRGTQVEFYITMSDADETLLRPYGAPDERYVFNVGEGSRLRFRSEVPAGYSLSQNYPNPVSRSSNAFAVIEYSIPVDTDVSLKVYDMLGREVAAPLKNFEFAGAYSVLLNTSTLTSGAYYYHLTAGDRQLTRRMIILD